MDEVNRLGLTSRLTTDEVGELVEIVRCPFRDLTVGGDQTVCRITSACCAATSPQATPSTR
ncbi:MAG: hypothetical protein R2719_05145 [Micropruina sp.]